MKKIVRLLFSALALLALALPLRADDDLLPEDLEARDGEEMVRPQNASAAGDSKPAVSNKVRAKRGSAKRKKKEEPPSEYKFKTEPTTPAYKFDKKADPILPAEKKKKKKAVKGKEGSGGQDVPKLKRVKSFNEKDDPAGPGGVQLPPGVKVPGMGGN
jgi:hypothetical protein